MYLLTTHQKEELSRVLGSFGIPTFRQDEVDAADKLEVWASSFEDPGPDFNEFRLLNADGEEIKTTRVPGY